MIKRLASWGFLAFGLFFVVAVMLLLFLWGLQSGHVALVWWGMASLGLIGLACFVVVWWIAGKLDQVKVERDQVRRDLDQVKAECDLVHGLSGRELCVLYLSREGVTVKAIAIALRVGDRTIERVRTELKSKGML